MADTSLDILLHRLENVRKTGQDSYMACCPAHSDKIPSLALREIADGKVLVHCFAGCSVYEVLQAVGMSLSDLFPPRQHRGEPERRPFPAMDALLAVAFEALIVAAAGAALLAGKPFSTMDRERLMVAISRIQAATTAVQPKLRRKGHE